MKKTSLVCLVVLFQFINTTAILAQGRSPNANKRLDEIDAVLPIRLRLKSALSVSPSGYNPTQIKRGYGLDKITGDGSGQVIAIIDAYGSSTIQNDLNTFSNTFGLPLTTIAIYYPQGKPRKVDGGWALETSLDVEWAHAIAPRATIMLVVAKSARLNDLLAAVDYAVSHGARQVSMSWGAAEFSSEANYDSHFNKVGVSFTASSGDNGAAVNWPACSPYIVGVGGTTLTLDSAGNVISETAWSGSGGGTSVYQLRPAYQVGWQNTPGRGVPDVSYNADPNTGFPVYIGNYNGSKGWIAVGGTSAGAPQWAAIIALVNSGRLAPLNGVNPALYSVAVSSYETTFRDISKGSNGTYLADFFYDFVTGLGSPLSNALVPALISK